MTQVVHELCKNTEWVGTGDLVSCFCMVEAARLATLFQVRLPFLPQLMLDLQAGVSTENMLLGVLTMQARLHFPVEREFILWLIRTIENPPYADSSSISFYVQAKLIAALVQK